MKDLGLERLTFLVRQVHLTTAGNYQRSSGSLLLLLSSFILEYDEQNFLICAYHLGLKYQLRKTRQST